MLSSSRSRRRWKPHRSVSAASPELRKAKFPSLRHGFSRLKTRARNSPRSSASRCGWSAWNVAARRLHRFAQGAVLVAHNADFDMAFLHRDEVHIGLSFDHPVLDTVMLSAILFGDSANHSLDALTTRLGIDLSEEARHTAIGDASATAEVLLKLIPALQARGLNTLGDVLEEVRRHGRLRTQSR